MKRIIGMAALCAVVFMCAGSAWGVSTVFECEVTGWANFATGEMFEGSASDLDGVEMIDWIHNAAGISFEATDDPDPDGIECRLNGTISADFFGTGTATVNRVPGYSYFIEIEDNRGPPDIVMLTASITHRPTHRNDGIVNFESPRTVVIPTEIDVLTGGSGLLGSAFLFFDGIRCKYRGRGETYDFVRCNSGYVAGDSIETTQAKLRIRWAAWRYPLTVVKTNIGTGTPAPGTADRYSILIAGPAPSEEIIYSFSGSVEDGDIEITMTDPILPPAP